MKSSCHWRRLCGAAGSEIAEAALILPMLFMLLFSIYWFGRAYSIYSTINHAARMAVLAAAAPSCANCGNTFPPDSAVAAVISETLTAANLDPTQATAVTLTPPLQCLGEPPGTCSSSSNLTICRNVVLDPNSTTQACGMIVSFQYPYKFPLPFTSLNNQTILLKAQAETGGEN